MKFKLLALLISIGGLVACCGCETATGTSSPQMPTRANIDASLYKLEEEPDGAVGVIDALQSANNGAPLVLVGRVGGTANPWIEGRAAFSLIDASKSIVADGEDSTEGEICTGDCCATERLGCTTLVKIIDDQGQLVLVDSRELLGLQESDMVVITGNAKVDEAGNFVMLAKGVYIRN